MVEIDSHEMIGINPTVNLYRDERYPFCGDIGKVMITVVSLGHGVDHQEEGGEDDDPV